jgi:hypothetical protein
MNGKHDTLDLRRWRNLASYLVGMGVETLYVLVLGSAAALVLAVFFVLAR